MAISITFSASCDYGGETKELTSTATIDASEVTTGTQTVGNTYEPIALASGTLFHTAIFKNLGTVDIAIRITASLYTTNQYAFYTVPPGQVFVLPYIHATDGGPGNVNVAARSQSGTCDVDYCIIS